MTQQCVRIAVVDDDISTRESLPELLQMLGFAAKPFCSAEELLASQDVSSTQCLITDISMPGMSGIELYDELMRRKLNIPVIFITARRDAGLRRSLLAKGAVDCLFKPFSEEALRAALDRALATAP